ncbi:MAG: hypothetical protein AABY32_01520 [Nanoarchaeota archaeon]
MKISTCNVKLNGVRSITNKILKEYDLPDIKSINEGDCYRWAWGFYKKYGGTLCTVSFYNYGFGHAFIKINNKYYDAESPNGVKDWRNLKLWPNAPISERQYNNLKNKRVMRMTVAEYRKFWDF